MYKPLIPINAWLICLYLLFSDRTKIWWVDFEACVVWDAYNGGWLPTRRSATGMFTTGMICIMQEFYVEVGLLCRRSLCFLSLSSEYSAGILFFFPFSCCCLVESTFLPMWVPCGFNWALKSHSIIVHPSRMEKVRDQGNKKVIYFLIQTPNLLKLFMGCGHFLLHTNNLTN
jgi:hypothetical protein